MHQSLVYVLLCGEFTGCAVSTLLTIPACNKCAFTKFNAWKLNPNLFKTNLYHLLIFGILRIFFSYHFPLHMEKPQQFPQIWIPVVDNIEKINHLIEIETFCRACLLVRAGLYAVVWQRYPPPPTLSEKI